MFFEAGMSHHNDSTLHQEPVPAWYKQFWPWFLIILPGIVVVASIITVVIAFQRADTLVADDYYKEGLAINKTVTDLNNAKSMHIHGNLAFTSDSIKLNLAGDTPISDNEILLELQHPLDDLQDITLRLQKMDSQQYSAALPRLSAGKWYISVQSTTADKPWRISTTAHLPAAELIIRPE